MPSRNCRTRNVGWRIANNEMLAEAIKDGGWIVAWTFINIIASVDNLGRMEGGKYQLRDMFFPHHDDVTPDILDKIMLTLISHGLVLRYKIRGLQYLQLPRIGNWSEIRGGMKDESDFPPPPEELIKEWAVKFSDVYMPCERRSDKVCPEGKGKGKGKGKDYIYIPVAEFVRMTDVEYKKLVSKYGETNTKRAIEALDNYKGSHGKKYKSDYRAILSWAMEKVLEKSNPTRCPICKGLGTVKEGRSVKYCECSKGKERKKKDGNSFRR